MSTILIIDADLDHVACIERTFGPAEHDILHRHPDDVDVDELVDQAPDVILMSWEPKIRSGLGLLAAFRDHGSRIPVVIVATHADIASAVDAMKAGAADFLEKPIEAVKLQLTLSRVLGQRQLHDKLSYYRERERRESELGRILGQSREVEVLKDKIRRIASAEALASHQPPSVLITGETGTGKDLIARAIHYSGRRHGGQFVRINCTAVSPGVFESELFGHVRGAFTDARGDKLGLFEVADGGTLFLDEIGDMRLDLQAKLLSVLDQRVVRPVGATRGHPINVQVIAATNRKLEAAVAAGEFREDLYHRLCVVRVPVPALRQRGADVLVLADHFLGQVAERFSIDVTGWTPEARALLAAYHWPGNVRELLHVIENAVVRAGSGLISSEHLQLPAVARGRLTIKLPNGCGNIDMDLNGRGPQLAEAEYRILMAALHHVGHNHSRAARLLGISRFAVRYRQMKYEAEQLTPNAKETRASAPDSRNGNAGSRSPRNAAS